MERTEQLQPMSPTASANPIPIRTLPILRLVERLNVRFNQALAFIAGIAAMCLALFICVNIVLRFFGKPISGVGEISGWLSAITMAFALGYTQIHKGHVDLDLFLSKLPKLLGNLVQGLMLFGSMIFYALLSYRLLLYANANREAGTLSETLAVIYYPYVYLVAIGFAGLVLALLTDALKLWFGQKGEAA